MAQAQLERAFGDWRALGDPTFVPLVLLMQAWLWRDVGDVTRARLHVANGLSLWPAFAAAPRAGNPGSSSGGRDALRRAGARRATEKRDCQVQPEVRSAARDFRAPASHVWLVETG